MSSITPMDNGSIPSDFSSGQSVENSTGIQDFLTPSSTDPPLQLFSSMSLPILEQPGRITIRQFFTALQDPALNFKRQLDKASITDQKTRRILSRAFAIIAAQLQAQYNAYNITINQITANAQHETDHISNDTNAINDAIPDQNTEADSLNSGNAQEASENQSLIDDYNTYIQAIIDLGGYSNGDGTYTLPAGATQAETDAILAQYNQAASDYSSQVAAFNSYRDGRDQEIGAYNIAATSYNNSVTSYNNDLTGIITTYNLQQIVQDNQLSFMFGPLADSRDTSMNTSDPHADLPSTFTSLPAVITPPAIPSWVSSNTNVSNIPTMSSLSYTLLDAAQLQLLYDGIYSDLYNQNASGQQAAIDTQTIILGYQTIQDLLNPVQDYTPDPRDFKPLHKRILPDAFIDSTKALTSVQRGGAGALTAQVTGIGSLKVARVFTQTAREQIANALLVNQANPAVFSDTRLEQLADQFAAVPLNLIGQSSLEAVLPSLASAASQLSVLPPESPVFSTIFALSFLNRTQELVNSPIPQQTVEGFIAQTPELANLTETAQAQLTAQLTSLLNLNLSLTATRLLLNKLGLIQLLPSVLSSLIPPEIVNLVRPALIQENQANQQELFSSIQNSFLKQGVQADKARFLAELGTQLAQAGLTSPTVSVISENTIRQDILTQSVQASLILSVPSLSLENAKQLSLLAVDQTLLNQAFNSSNQFIENLSNNLRALGINHATANTVAQEAIVIPSTVETEAPPPISSNRSQVTSGVTSDSIRRRNLDHLLETLDSTLSEQKLVGILTRRTLQLLTPQVGADLAKAVSVEIARALFGQTNPDAADLSNVKSPFSLVNVVKAEIDRYRSTQDDHQSEKIASSFREFMKDNVQLDVFLEKLMRPQDVVLYSTATGIIYGGHTPSNWKKSIDILV